jgi:hypothetical protein
MHWHLAPTTYTLRGYDQPGGFEQHAPFKAVAQVMVVGDRAVIWAMLGSEAVPITRRDWVAIRALLKELGVTEVIADRHGEVVSLTG